MTGQEIATRDERPASSLAAFDSDARIAFTLAKALAKTSDARKFNANEAEIAAVILKGAEMGLKPIASLAAFDVIQGSVVPKAVTMRGLAQRAGHVLELVESTDKVCVMRGRRADSTEWQIVEFTIDDAQRLGLTGKDNWKKQPKAMLVARATSALARLVAADVLIGAGVDMSSEEVDRPAPVPVTVTRVSVADVLAEPVDEATGEVLDVEEPPDMPEDLLS